MFFKKYLFFKIIIIICFIDLFMVVKYCYIFFFFMFCFLVEFFVIRFLWFFLDVECIKDFGFLSDLYCDCVVWF